MPVNAEKMTSGEIKSVIVLMVVGVVLGWAVSGALRTDPPRDHKLVIETQKKQARLDQASRGEWAILRAERVVEGEGAIRRRPLPYAILGDGIAGTAAAINLGTPVRVFGSRSFWADLHGVAEVWQTGDSLGALFVSAGLNDPRKYDSGAKSDRLLWLAVENSRLEALGKPGIHYLHSSCEFSLAVVPASGSEPARWRVSNCAGDFEDIAGPLVIATGASSARTIVTPMPRPSPAAPAPLADAATRLALLQGGLLVAGDDYLAQTMPEPVDTLVVLGSGGNAADVARHALSERAAKTVVLIGPTDPVEKTPAYGKLRSEHGDDICRSTAIALTVGYVNSLVQINGASQLDCVTLNGKKRSGVQVNLVVESLGRVAGDLPAVLQPVRSTSPNFTAIPVRDRATHALISVRLDFAGMPHPVLLIGAAADLAEALFGGTALNELQAGRQSLMEEINPEYKADRTKPQENPRVGFAAAAFMGSRMVRQCFAAPSGAAGDASFNDADCR